MADQDRHVGVAVQGRVGGNGLEVLMARPDGCEQHRSTLVLMPCDRLMGYVKAKKFDGLIYRKPKELRATLFVDSDYAKDLDSRKSTSSGLHTIGGTLVNWESKTQHVVMLLCMEAEYISLVKGACKNKFVTMLMDEVMRYPKEERSTKTIWEQST